MLIWLIYLCLKARDTSSWYVSLRAPPLRYTKLRKAQRFLILRPKRNFCYDRLKIIFSSIISVSAKFSMWSYHSPQIKPQARRQDKWVRVGHFLIVWAGPPLHGPGGGRPIPFSLGWGPAGTPQQHSPPLQNHLGHLFPTVQFPPCLSLDCNVQKGGHMALVFTCYLQCFPWPPTIPQQLLKKQHVEWSHEKTNRRKNQCKRTIFGGESTYNNG